MLAEKEAGKGEEEKRIKQTFRIIVFRQRLELLELFLFNDCIRLRFLKVELVHSGEIRVSLEESVGLECH